MAYLSEVDTSDWFTGVGTIVYDPIRVTSSGDLSTKQVVDKRTSIIKSKTDWWCTLELDSSITDYYRWWANKYVNPLGYNYEDSISKDWPHLRDKREDLLPPMWGAHMSLVRGEIPADQYKGLWKKHDRRQVEFKYSNNVRFSGDKLMKNEFGQLMSIDPAKIGVYWFVDAVCDVGKEIREELGFPSNWTFHITVGRVRGNQNFTYTPPRKKIML